MRSSNIAMLILVSVFVLSIGHVESGRLMDYVSNAKSYLVQQIRDGLISRTSFGEAMDRIGARFEEAKQTGDLDGKDDTEISALYYRIVIDEVRKLRENIAMNDLEKNESNMAQFASSCTACVESIADNLQSNDESIELDLEEETELMNELDSLDAKEAEMGFGLDPETKRALKLRTFAILSDLMQNELKTLATIIVNTWLAGAGAPGLIGPVVAAANISLKSKLLEFLITSIMDMFASMLGGKPITLVTTLAPLDGAPSTTESPSSSPSPKES